jgi:transitional endoplasmic reticulum ATPase
VPSQDVHGHAGEPQAAGSAGWLQEGAVLELTGKRTTAALALAPYPEDEGLDVIRLDGLQRGNAGVSIGDQVTIRPADPKPARKIQLAPAQKNLRLVGSGEMLRRTLFQRPLVAGDIISASIYQRGQVGADHEHAEDLFRIFLRAAAFGCGRSGCSRHPAARNRT